MLALSQTAGYVIVGLVASIIPLGSAYLAFRANREATKATAQQSTIDSTVNAQGGLIDDQREEIAGLRTEIRNLRSDFDSLRLRHEDCERERLVLTRRVAELEQAS